MRYAGDFTPGKTVYVSFNTKKLSDQTPITLAGTPAVSVYKRGSTTESTSGVTLTVDYDSRTGYHVVAIDTSADGAFYAAANDFSVVITTGTVDSVSVVGHEVGFFSLSNRSALRPTTADRTLDVTATGAAGIDWGNVENPTTSIAFTGTTISTSQQVASVSGAVGSVTGAVGSVTGNVGGNVTGSVGSVAAGGITAASIADGAIDAATFAADVDAEILSYLVDDATRIDASALNTATGTTIPAIVADTNELKTDWADGGRLDVILDARASQTSVDDVPTNSELATAITTGLTTALTEGYRGTGATGSVRDLLYEIIAHMGESSISSTTKTLKKLDGSTTAKTYTLNSSTAPTSITETT